MTVGDLADPNHYTEPLNLGDADSKTLLRQLRMMLLIRYVEERIGDMIVANKVICPCHLGIGQEAIAVGVAESLRKTDRVFGAHRSHPHYLALGGNVYELFAEVLGRVTGCSKGMGGSMHLRDLKNGFIGSVPIVSGTIPLAIGAALAAKKDGCGGMAVCFFGDGASEEGSLHECLNFAANFKLPILFVCENNFFSSHLHIDLRQPANSISRFAEAHRVPHKIVDGNDVVAIERVARAMIDRARTENTPSFLEAVTYRWRGHVGPREDLDVGVKRSEALFAWKHRDPIRRLSEALEKAGSLTSREFNRMREDVLAQVDQEWHQAEEAPFPEKSALLDCVYKQGEALATR